MSFWDTKVWNIGKWVIPAVGASEWVYLAGKKAAEDAGKGVGLIPKDGEQKAEGYAPPATLDPDQQLRTDQMSFIDQLKAQAAGQGPSIAQQQLQTATDANISQAMAAGQTQAGHGLNNMAAQRAIAGTQGKLQQESANQSALLRNQEMLQARTMLGNTLGGVRGQNISATTDAEKLRQNWNIALLDESARKRAADNQLAGSAINAGGGAVEKWAAGQPGKTAPTQPTQPAQPTAPDVEPPTDYSGGLASGGLIAGRAPSTGDSPSNDTVPALLSPGEIVIPRSVAQSEDAPDKAAAFVAAIKSNKKTRGNGDYGPVVKGMDARLRRIEAMFHGGAVQ